MPTHSALRLGAAVCGALLLTGCANHLSERSEHEDRVERKLLSHSLFIDLGEPAVLEVPQRHIRINEQKTFEVSEFEVTRRYDRYTPYQAWRELYEIPFGMVSVMAGIGANVLNVALLGRLPHSVTRDPINYGFASLNPFLNAESKGRSQQNLARLEEQLKDKRTEYSSLPWAERPVQVKAGTQTHELLTDRHGVLHLNLLDPPFSEQDASKINTLHLRVEDPGDGTSNMAALTVSRALRRKLPEARELIYADLEDADVGQWTQRVRRLAEMGMEEEAREMEQSLIELTRNDPELQEELLASLKNTGRVAAVSGTP